MPSSHCLIPSAKRVWLITVVLIITLASLHPWAPAVNAQDTVTGAFEGTVSHSQTRERIAGALVQIINRVSDLTLIRRADAQGRFYQGLLPPGVYTIRVSAPGFKAEEKEQLLITTAPNQVIPIPILLEPETVASAPTSPAALTQPNAPASSPPSAPYIESSIEDRDAVAEINRTDGRRSGAFTDYEVVALPLGGVTRVRTFDELALLLPGVALPPQTIGNGTGPGVGAGVGSAGQFAVNGLRSRANNFTVDGSDNNDEDIGVRRQGFMSLIPQPIESIKEYQVITLLAPAQFGRNIGAQVNAVSKSGGSETHGTFFGLFNSSQLNARNFFDTTNGNSTSELRAGNNQPVLLNDRPITVQNQGGGEDSLTLGQGGLVIGGPLSDAHADSNSSMHYFFSAEGHLLHATKESNFAVPTVEERGFLGTGASAIFRNPITGAPFLPSTFINALNFRPANSDADSVFSLFPFPNNPAGIYGPDTLTQLLPANGEGKILSGKFDGNFKVRGRQQSLTKRYNFTQDWREIPVSGGAIFSTLRPRVRTQNLSIFLNSEVSGPASITSIFNQVRLSYGRTRLNFEEVRDTNFLIPSGFPETPFLLNAPLLTNATVPASQVTTIPPLPPTDPICTIFPLPFQCRPQTLTTITGPNTGPVRYVTNPLLFTTETDFGFGPVGQVVIAGFSPVGVDVYNFPQRRVNNTYQFADTLTVQYHNHRFAFGTDNRRTDLNSDLPRNSRSIITFSGAPQVTTVDQQRGLFAFTNRFMRPVDLAAAGAPSSFTQTLTTAGTASFSLRYYQLNFFGQDTWRIRRHLSLSFGLRYEYNTPPRELNRRIENTFNSPLLNEVPGLRNFIEGRSRIFDPDRNNFAPRVGIAFSRDLLRKGQPTVLRAGYGIFYDQILGAVGSQSRNVYPDFLNINFPGGFAPFFFGSPFNVQSPRDVARFTGFLVPGSLNTLFPGTTASDIGAVIGRIFLGGPIAPENFLEVTLPARRIEMPTAQHYSFTVEQQFGRNLVVSAAYVGTQGRHLLRFSTPNLGPNLTLGIQTFSPLRAELTGLALGPGTPVAPDGTFFFDRSLFGRARAGRPVSRAGTVFRFETTANSRYDALQLQVRGRFQRSLQYQTAYTLAKATDDVSDVFDLAGASALPQNSLTLAGERAPASFDVRHRFVYSLIYDLPALSEHSRALRLLLAGLQIASTGRFNTGQPFTVNSVFDVNLDGNLTDRLNITDGIAQTGDRRQPLRLTTDDPTTLLAHIGRDGNVGRNTFRAGNLLELDVSVTKKFTLSTYQSLTLRSDIFNFINRANFGIPVRLLEAPGFGQATDTVTPGRRIQFALKYSF